MFVAHAKLGELNAKLNWKLCADIDAQNKETKHIKKIIKSTNGHIEKKLSFLNVFCTDEQIAKVRSECAEFHNTYKESYEKWTEEINRPHGIIMDETAIVNLTDKAIPNDIKLVLSFGPKFVFPTCMSSINKNKVLAMLEHTIDKAVDPLLQDMTAKEAFIALKNEKFQISDHTQKWLIFIKKRTDEFFKVNPDIVPIKSDKGNHVVIISQNEYNKKMFEHLDNPAYTKLDQNPLENLIAKEMGLIELLKEKEKTKKLIRAYQPNTLHLPLFYGVIKIHKNNKIRPITSTTGAVGYAINKFLDEILKIIFKRGPHHIKDSFDFKEKIDQVVLNHNEGICSMDVESMYTSLPILFMQDLVMKEAEQFDTIFNIKPAELLSILNFVMKECTVFQFNNEIYRQEIGIPMGSVVSPFLANLFMDHSLNALNLMIPNIKFVAIFVDDSIFVIESDLMDIALDILNNIHPGVVKYTIEKVNNKGEINFLNMTLIRHQDSIITKWYQKPFASNRLLNYLSAHKRSIVMNTAIHFVKTVLILSDARFFHSNRPRVMKRLFQNNFPSELVEQLISTEYTLMKPFKKSNSIHNFYKSNDDAEVPISEENTQYVAFPHAIPQKAPIKKIINTYKDPTIILADTVRNTRTNNVKNLKDKIEIEKQNNVIVQVECKCKKHIKIDATKFNETAHMTALRLKNKITKCNRKNHAFQEVKYTKGLAFYGQNQNFLKYIRYENRTRLKDDQLNFPNPYLCKLLK